jgi:large subunit ribosomal protein L10
MPNVEAKAQEVADLRARFAESSIIVVADFKGATVKQIDKVRRGVEKGGVKLTVVKNTLASRAVVGTDKQGLADHFIGNCGVLFGSPDPIATARLLRDQLKDNDKFVVKVGIFEGQVLDAKGVAAVAEMAGREEMLSKMLATIQEGPRQAISVIQAPARDLVYLLANFASKLEDASGEAAP